MSNIKFGILAFVFLIAVTGCNWQTGVNGATDDARSNTASIPVSATNRASSTAPATAKKAYRISGTIDDAKQEGDVCDTSVKFKVPGTLEFEFTPTSPTKGEYTYSGPFNATGSGPYEIRDDGTMLVDGTGCIMGRCAEYSHEWKAESIDPKTCK